MTLRDPVKFHRDAAAALRREADSARFMARAHPAANAVRTALFDRCAAAQIALAEAHDALAADILLSLAQVH